MPAATPVITRKWFLTETVGAAIVPAMDAGSPNLRIAELRKLRNWSQAQLGERICCTQQHVKRLEEPGRKISMKWATRLADAFGRDPFDFYQDDAPLPDAHRRLLAAFARLPLTDQEMLVAMAQVFVERAAKADNRTQ